MHAVQVGRLEEGEPVSVCVSVRVGGCMGVSVGGWGEGENINHAKHH